MKTTPYVILKLSLFALLNIGGAELCAQSSTTHAGTHQPSHIAGKPISFYLNHNAITNDAKLYFAGKLAPSDDERTFAILDSTLTHHHEIRPFYFFTLNQILKTSDGALSEYASIVCSRYFSQHPCEFLQWQADPVYEASLRKWADFIAFDLYTPEAFKKYTAELKTAACKTRELDNFINELRRIVTELNEH